MTLGGVPLLVETRIKADGCFISNFKKHSIFNILTALYSTNKTKICIFKTL